MSEKYTVTFFDDDKSTILEEQEVEQGSKVRYQGKLPEKASENGIEYTFTGWEMEDGNIDQVMNDMKLFAKYEESPKVSSKEDNSMFELSQENAENSKLNDVMQAGQKVNIAEKATRNLSLEQKKDLVQKVRETGSVDLEQQNENERDD